MSKSSLTPLAPPVAERRPHRSSHHNRLIEDPYAWLRDPAYPQVNDPEILGYLQAENRYFDAMMAPLQPLVQVLFEEMKARRPDEDAGVPYNKNGYRYQWRYLKDAQYRTWYRTPLSERMQLDFEDARADAESVLLDEAALAAGQEYFSLGALTVSPCGNFLAYSTDTEGNERYTLHVVNIEDGRALTPPLPHTIGPPVWDSQSQSFLYTVVNEQWQPLQVYRRTLSSPDEDELVYEEQDTGFSVSVELSQSEEFALISSSSHTTNEVYFLPRADLGAAPRLMRPREEGVEYHVDHGNGEFIIRSNLRQANFDMYRTPDNQPEGRHWQRFMQGDRSHYLTGHMVLKHHLIVEERLDGLDQIRVLDAHGNEHYIDFPESAYAAGIGINPEFDTRILRLSYTSLVTPDTVYAYDLNQRELTTLKVQKIPSGYDPAQFTTRRLMACARDGTQVPISLVQHIDTPIDGTACVYLYGYGAYGIASTPSFSPSRISLLERGFIFAIAHIRGGDELGYHWYTDGKLDKRTNTFNDFVDCARFLIEQDLTRPGRIVIAGGSAGGELMGAVVNAAPQLWGGVAAHVPFVDVLNTMLDATLALTPGEWTEWGNPIKDADAFELIRSYSPYDQLQPGAYPPMLVTAGLNDPRVTYWEPAKYVARLRTLKQDNTPLLLKTNMGAGHGGQSGRFDALKELAEEYAFLINALESDQ